MKTNSSTASATAAFFVAITIIAVFLTHSGEASESLHPESRIYNGDVVDNPNLLEDLHTLEIVMNTLYCRHQKNDNKDAVTVKVSKVIIHEEYKIVGGEPNEFNIAIIEFEKQVTNVKNVPVNYKNYKSLENKKLHVVGWGKTSSRDQKFCAADNSETLRYGIFRTLDRKLCNEKMNYMCIEDYEGAKKKAPKGQKPQQASQSGDLGAPLLVKNRDGDFELVGVFVGNTENKKYGKCLSTKELKPWIESKKNTIIADKTQSDKKDKTYVNVNKENHITTKKSSYINIKEDDDEED